MSHCETEADHCDENEEENCCSGGESTESNEGCCPVESVINKWETAFYHAKHEVMVDVLKEKIKAKWGTKMDQVGDAVIEAMAAEWEASFQKAEIRSTLREKVTKALFSE